MTSLLPRLGPPTSHHIGSHRDAAARLVAILGSSFVAIALASNRPSLAALLAAAPLLAFLSLKSMALLSHTPAIERQVAALWAALVFSTLVWRIRTTEELNADPLDPAAWSRFGLVALAVTVALSCLLFRGLPRRFPFFLRFVGLYVLAAFVSATASPAPPHALYRALELGAGVGLFLVALLFLGDRLGITMIRLAVGTVVVILGVVWLEALLLPSGAWNQAQAYYAFVPYSLQGAIPRFSANTVGTLGTLLAIWGLAQPATCRGGQLLRWAALLGGLLTLAAAQYRTGAIGFLLVAALVLALRRRYGLVLVAVGVLLAVVALGGHRTVLTASEQGFTKGQSVEQLRTLNSRTVWWEKAEELISDRPFLGWGLNVGSREALSALARDTTSTLHSTWVEALIGTGLVGTVFLALAALAALRQAWKARSHPFGLAVLGMLVFLVVRSFTGSTIDLFGLLFLLFGALALAADALARSASIEEGSPNVPSLRTHASRRGRCELP